MAHTPARVHVGHAKILPGPFRILDLPPELVEHIFEQLGGIKRCALLLARRVCRAFRDHSLLAFGTRFFDHVDITLHPLSLTFFLEIANHPTLCKFVRQVTISSESISSMADVSLQSNREMLEDLQTSMEKSGMDCLVLSAAFRKLKNVHIVGIDNDLFCRAAQFYDTVRCGRKYIIKDDTSVLNFEVNQGRAFGTIFAALKDYGIAERTTLYIKTILPTGYNHYTKLFDPTSAEWAHSFSGNVINVGLFGSVTSPWALDLLLLSRNLKGLQFFNCDDIINFRHPTSGLFTWVYLRQLQLDNCTCLNDTLVKFLEFHKDTLTQIYVSDINLISGSWRQPLQTMETMSKLEEMCLGSLYETTHPSKDGLIFDHFYNLKEQK